MMRVRSIATVAVIALGLGACGSDQNSSPSDTTTEGDKADVSCATGTISGAGATFPQTIVQQWIKDYGAACPGATVNYQGVGSGAGIQQFTAGTVDFGASDAVLSATEQTAAEAKGPVLQIPWTAGGLAVMYNLPEVKNLRLGPATLASIYAGAVTRWNDPEIKADNPDASLPDTGIQVVHRSDGSGTTAVFTSYMTAAAPDAWKAGAAKDVPWPTGQGAKGSDGVTAAVKQAAGAIGYAELSFAKANSLGVAAIKNPAGKYVTPSGAAVAAALASAEVPVDLEVKANYAPTDAAAYPISTTTWVLVHSKSADAAKGALLKSFLGYALSQGQYSAEGLYYAPLPPPILSKAQAAVASIQA